MEQHGEITALTAAIYLKATCLHRRLSDLREMGCEFKAKPHPRSKCLVYSIKSIPKHVRKQLNALKKCAEVV